MGERGTKMQADVLAVLQQRGVPVSAYDVLGELRTSNPKIAPQTIYRALSSLMDRGEVHRVESLNAFIASRRNGHHRSSILSICDACGRFEDYAVADLSNELSSITGRIGFDATRHVIEVRGLCAACGDLRMSA